MCALCWSGHSKNQVGVARVHQPVIAAPAVTMDDAIQCHFTPDSLLQRGFLDIRDNLCGHPSVALVQAKHDGLAPCAPSALAANTARPKVGFVYFHLPRPRAVFFTLDSDTLTQLDVDGIYRAQADPCQSCSIRGRQVQGEVTQNFPKSLLCDSGARIVPVFPFHYRSLDRH